MNASLSINLNNNQPYAVGNDNYYDDDGGTDSYDSFRTPPRAPPLPVTAAPAPLYDSSEMVVGGRCITLLPTTALMRQHHSIFPSHQQHTFL